MISDQRRYKRMTKSKNNTAYNTTEDIAQCSRRQRAIRKQSYPSNSRKRKGDLLSVTDQLHVTTESDLIHTQLTVRLSRLDFPRLDRIRELAQKNEIQSIGIYATKTQSLRLV